MTFAIFLLIKMKIGEHPNPKFPIHISCGGFVRDVSSESNGGCGAKEDKKIMGRDWEQARAQIVAHQKLIAVCVCTVAIIFVGFIFLGLVACDIAAEDWCRLLGRAGNHLITNGKLDPSEKDLVDQSRYVLTYLHRDEQGGIAVFERKTHRRRTGVWGFWEKLTTMPDYYTTVIMGDKKQFIAGDGYYGDWPVLAGPR